MRGNRVIKNSSTDVNAFHSPNFPPLAKIDVAVDIKWELVRRADK